MTNSIHHSPIARLFRGALTLLTITFGLLSTSVEAGPAFPEFVDPNSSEGNEFGKHVVVLNTGNVVITSPMADIGGTDAGAVYLFNGATGALISTLTGGREFDRVGLGGVTALTNGNYVVISPAWDNGTVNGAGAVTWGNGTTGISGVVSVANSLVGSSEGDNVGIFGVTALTNGNYVVSSQIWNNGAGAATWGNGTTGISGVVSETNSLVGSKVFDNVGDVAALTNGNYVVSSPNWDNGAATDAGAVTWGNGTTGISGVVSETNSFVGSTVSDQVGLFFITLTNGNYVVRSPYWDNGAVADVGAVTWGNGTTGTSGVVSAANSLVGSTASDQVGITGGVTALTNGNYVVSSPDWDNGAATDAGAVTWGNGNTGTSGVVSQSNSLVGSTANNYVGVSGVTALTNGNYVVRSSFWDNGALANVGAVTWGNGTTGTSGVVSQSNSLIGSAAHDRVGYKGITTLINGNYVVLSSDWNNGAVADAGAVTWGNGTTGTSGVVSAANSLVGSTVNDQVGITGGVTALTNGNYVVGSYLWDNGAVTNVGAVTWGNGTTGTSGVVSAANSLVGSTASDNVGFNAIIALTNGNYVVGSYLWDNGAVTDAGAVTWGNGTAGTSGVVSAANSLVGSTADDEVGIRGIGGIGALTNGNYVVSSPTWDNGAVADVGAVTWGNGTTGTSGVVSAANSLVGSTANDQVSKGSGGIILLTNGNYVVRSHSWDNGAVTDAGAATWGNGTTGISGPVSAANSLVGLMTNTGSPRLTDDNLNNHFIVPFLSEGKVRLGSQVDGLLTTVTGVTPASGPSPSGTRVTIIGTGFTGTTSVTIGGRKATGFVVVNSTTITATTPPGSPGSASVLVTSPRGTNVANTLFTYLPPIIEISGNTQVITNGDPSPRLQDDTEFFEVPLLNTQAIRTFTIRNIGTAPLNITGPNFVQITGAAATDFAVTVQAATLVAPGNSTSFEVTFDPRLPGPRSATVTINSDADNAASFSFAISGEGLLPVREPQTITFAPPATLYLGQSPFTLTSTASSGLPVTLAVVSGPATVIGNSLTLHGPGTVRITATQAGNTEYLSARSVTRNIIVRADPTSLTLLNLTQTYDGNTKPISTMGVSSPTITYKIAGVEGSTPPINAGRYAVKAVAGTVTKTGILVINKAVLTIIPTDARRFVGFDNPTFTYTVSGYRGTDTVAVVTKGAILSTTAKATSPLGVYPITAAGAAALNYTFNYQLGSLVVEGFAGNYEALLVDGSNLPVGKLTLTVPTTGRSFTGKLFTATETAALPLAGGLSTFPLTGLATGGVTLTKNRIPYNVSFTLPPYGNVLATVMRDNLAFGGATTGRKLLTLPKGRVVNFAGAHTAVLEPATPAATNVPVGAGWAISTVSTTGTMNLAGRLGDGTAFTASLPADGDINPGYRLWVQPYKAARTGSYLGGSFTLAPHPNPLSNPSLTNRRSIEQIGLTWKKTSLLTDATFRNPFGPVSTVMMLDPWLKPMPCINNTTAITLATRLGLTGNNIKVTHSATGSMSNTNLPTTLALSATNLISVTAPSNNPTKWKITKLDPATGKVEGSFELVDGTVKRPATFSAILRQPATPTDTLIGNGHYIVAPLSGTEKLVGEILFER